eukprot:CAMPEP_0194498358 /NCGR_PEP_ID=MMETSP0253-20130528/15015_1 /TAXON_ID=2966 /ORGANISM="Noctiluca scintillans" /LENGTH=354 /DNA_ID=CAMNT_0039339991 /DNA_START=56 /DNA_END=1120 /DNA_ORIENTATION=+
MRPTPWDPEPEGFGLGAGPTIAHAVDVSKREEDIQLVLAASKGDAAAVAKALAGASSINVHVRLPGACISSRATTPLHAASAIGAVDVVRLLLERRAEVSQPHGILRTLTPLHLAANVETATVLLDAGASPIPMDPREPHAVWYHEQRRRKAVASLIKGRCAELVRGQRAQERRLHPAGTNETPARARALPAPLNASEHAAVQDAWGVSGDCLLAAKISPVQSDSAGDCECAICMVEILPEDQILLLPCGGTLCNGVLEGGRPHVFHSSCMERWLLTKAGACPTCRCDLRRHLPKVSSPPTRLSVTPATLRRQPTARHSVNAVAVDTPRPSGRKSAVRRPTALRARPSRVAPEV